MRTTLWKIVMLRCWRMRNVCKGGLYIDNPLFVPLVLETHMHPPPHPPNFSKVVILTP